MGGNGLHVSNREPACICALEAERRDMILQPTNLGRQVAYQSQFNDATNRAHAGKERIKSRLIADLEPDEWMCRPNRNGCGGATYNRDVERYDHYDDVLDYGCVRLSAKLFGK